MIKVSRREFVRKMMALGLVTSGTNILGSNLGCATPQAAAPTSLPPTAPAIGSTPASTVTATAARTQIPTAEITGSTATPAPTGVSYLAVARGESPAAIVQAALKAIGGIERFVKPGQDVIIKPNICNASNSFEYASTTNPEVVATLVRLCLGAGAKRVRVMDFPFSGTPEAAYKKSGIADAVQAAGGQMEVMSSRRFQEVAIPKGQDLKNCKIYKDALEADVLINVPIAKHHNMAGLTLGMKNLMGLIQDRGAIHSNFGQRLPDIASVIAPGLTVIDAVRILMNHGPTGGNLSDVKLMNTVIASHDIVATDACATSLFNQKPEQIAYIVGGAKMGLGTLDLKSIKVEELAV